MWTQFKAGDVDVEASKMFAVEKAFQDLEFDVEEFFEDHCRTEGKLRAMRLIYLLTLQAMPPRKAR